MATTSVKKGAQDAEPGVTGCSSIGKLTPKIGTESSHSFHLAPRRKGREERAEVIPKEMNQAHREVNP